MGKRRFGELIKTQTEGVQHIDQMKHQVESFGEYDAYNLAPTTTKQEQAYGRGASQSGFDKAAKGAAKLGIKTFTRTAAGLGYAFGAIDGLVNEARNPEEDNFSRVYDNEVVKNMEALEEKFANDPALEIYKQRAYDGNLIDQMSTVDFWAEDVGDGLSFLLSAAIGAKGASLAAKGIGGIAKGTKLGNFADATTKVTGLRGDTALAMVYNTVNEAGVEAHETNKTVYQNLLERGFSEDVAKEKAAKAAQQTFVANAWVLLLPNLIQSNMFTHAFDDSSDVLNRMIKKQKIDIQAENVVGKTAKNMATSIASEGLWEENAQLAVSNYYDRMSAFADDPNTGEAIAGIAAGMVDNFTTDEGQKSMMLGAILGAGGALVATPNQVKGDQKAINAVQQELQGINSQLYNTQATSIYQTEEDGTMKLDAEGNPIVDTDALGNLVYQGALDKTLMDEYTRSLLAGDVDHGKVVKDMALSKYAYSMLTNPALGSPEQAAEIMKLAVNKRAGEIDTENPNLFDVNTALADNLGQIDAYKEIYRKVDRSTRTLDTRQEAFTNRLRGAAFGAAVRQQTFNQLAVKAEQAEQADQALAYKKIADDAGRNYDKLTNRKGQKALYKEWKKTSSDRTAVLERIKEAQENGDAEALYQSNKEAAIFHQQHGMHNAKANDFGILAESPEDQIQHGKTFEQDIQYKVGSNYLNRTRLDNAISEGAAPSDAVKAQLDTMEEVGPEFGQTAQTYLAQQNDHVGQTISKLEGEQQRLVAQMSPAAKLADGSLDVAEFSNPPFISELTAQDRTLFEEYQALEQSKEEGHNSISDNTALRFQIENRKDSTRHKLNAGNTRDGILFYSSIEDMKGYEYIASQGQTEGYTDTTAIAKAIQNLKRDRKFYNDQIKTNYIKEQALNNLDTTLEELLSVLEQVEERSKNIMEAQKAIKTNQKAIIEMGLEEGFDSYEDARYQLETLSPGEKQDFISRLKARRNLIVSETAAATGNPDYAIRPETTFTRSMLLLGNQIGAGVEYRIAIKPIASDLEKFQDLATYMSKTVSLDLGDAIIHDLNVLGERHVIAMAIDALIKELQSPVKHNIVLRAMYEAAEAMGVYPTPQQTLAIRQLVNGYFLRNNAPDFARTANLTGIAGTGKTTMIALVLDTLKRISSANLTHNEIVAVAHTEESSEVIANSLGTAPTSFDAVMGMDLSAHKVLVIDEVGGLTDQQGEAIRQKLKGNNDVYCILLGDPTQITAITADHRLSTLPYFSSSGNPTSQVNLVQPLSLVMRTGVSDIATIAGKFRGATGPVEGLQASASHPVASRETAPVGVHLVSSPTTLMERLKLQADNGRSKLVIVGSEQAKSRYPSTLGPNTKVVTAMEAQGATVDEAYVDIHPDEFATLADYNTIMYTATSRPVTYLMVANMPNSEVIIQEGISNDDSKKLERLELLREDFKKEIEGELALYDEVPEDSTVTVTTEEAVEEAPLAEPTRIEEINNAVETEELTPLVPLEIEEEVTEPVVAPIVTDEDDHYRMEEITTTEPPMDSIEDTVEEQPMDDLYEDYAAPVSLSASYDVAHPSAYTPLNEELVVRVYVSGRHRGVGLFSEGGQLEGILDLSENNLDMPLDIKSRYITASEVHQPVVLSSDNRIPSHVNLKSYPEVDRVKVSKVTKGRVKYKPTEAAPFKVNGAGEALRKTLRSGYYPNASYTALAENSYVIIPTISMQRGKQGKELANIANKQGVQLGVPLLVVKDKIQVQNPLTIRLGVRPLRSNEVNNLRAFKNDVKAVTESTPLEYPSKEFNEAIKAFSGVFKVQKGAMVKDKKFDYDTFAMTYERNTGNKPPAFYQEKFAELQTKLPSIVKAVYGVKTQVQKFKTKEEAKEEAEKMGMGKKALIVPYKEGYAVRPETNAPMHTKKILRYGEGTASQEMHKLAMANKSLRYGRPLRRTRTNKRGESVHSGVPLLGDSDAYAKEVLKKLKDQVINVNPNDQRLSSLGTIAHGKVPIAGVMELANQLENLGYVEEVASIMAGTEQTPPLTMTDLEQITESFNAENSHALQARYTRKRGGKFEIHEGNTYLRPHVEKPSGKVSMLDTTNPIFDKIWDNVESVKRTTVRVTPTTSSGTKTEQPQETTTPDPFNFDEAGFDSMDSALEDNSGDINYDFNEDCI